MGDLSDAWEQRGTGLPPIELDTIIARAVGEEGQSAQIKFGGAVRGFLEDPVNKDKIEGSVVAAYKCAFGKDPDRIGAVAVPYSEMEDGDDEEGV